MTPAPPVARTVPPAEWREAAEALRVEGYTWFCYLDAVDDIDRAETFTLTLRLTAPASGDVAELTTTVPRDGGTLTSLRGLWPAAGWSERGLAEGFGIAFDGGDPRPLLLHPDSGAPAFPLRKERLLPARQEPWPGAKEDPTQGGRTRRRLVPTGVPDAAAETPQQIATSAYGSARGRR